MDRTGADVAAHLAKVTPAARRRDAEALAALMREVTGREPELWAGGIVGFGSCHYRYPTGNEGDSPLLSFAPRKVASTIYLLDGVGAHADELGALGPHTTGVGCLYIKDVPAVDLEALRGILRASLERVEAGPEGFAEITVTG
ncbi:DUF1801 domain-containing protein [uncultured Microbacterium sp.]|uniref:YdhG-like domain-containing protein n=1 Tax=uncultured Microbacterium sp. TaxID=191216 RepID=A0A1Y5P1E4_9MICO|nr:DUF1801 domain-containing protein [uncultured Microbacterium sp.]SBS72497.1 conserved hypothetical protein [uncultured Microbacterium sp.]